MYSQAYWQNYILVLSVLLHQLFDLLLWKLVLSAPHLSLMYKRCIHQLYQCLVTANVYSTVLCTDSCIVLILIIYMVVNFCFFWEKGSSLWNMTVKHWCCFWNPMWLKRQELYQNYHLAAHAKINQNPRIKLLKFLNISSFNTTDHECTAIYQPYNLSKFVPSHIQRCQKILFFNSNIMEMELKWKA